MSLRYGILGLLNYGPSTGYEINTFFNNSLKLFWDAQTSQIYRELTMLEKNGLAQSQTMIQHGKPNKNVFKITEKGKEAFVDWMKTPFNDYGYTFKSPLLMKLFFAAGQERNVTTDMLKKFIEDMRTGLEDMSQANSHIDDVVENKPSRQNDSIYWKITSDFGQRYFKMAIEWAENSLLEIENITKDEG